MIPEPSHAITAVVIVPVFNGGTTLARCLSALARSEFRPDEVVVADDASTDGSAAIAEAHGARVHRMPGPRPVGPAAARNAAAQGCRADALVFIDSDVEVQPGTLGRLLAPIADEPGIAATFGSYDDAPPARSIPALYANLRHHHVHQRANREAGTFWAGCGAVRRTDYERAGGFAKEFHRPSVEDIELGLRLKQAGRRIRCMPEAQAKHLKAWTLRQLWRTDIVNRAIPWSRMMLAQGAVPNDLNTGTADRIAAVVAHLIWLTALLAALTSPALLLVTAGLAALWAWMSRDLIGLLARKGGAKAAVGGAFLHWAYHLYGSVVFGLTAIGNLVRPAHRHTAIRP